MKEDPLAGLLDWAVAACYEDLPAATVDAAKTCLLNASAAMLAGSGAPGAPEIVRQVREWGGRPESTVAVHGLKVPAPMAALANGVMAHAMDYDDTQVGTGLHANVVVVPALLAATEVAPRASGRDFLLAHTLGLELACRMTLAATNRGRHPWLTTTLFGIFGATLAAGKVLGLDAASLRHALGIAYSSAAGNRQGLLDGTLIQRVQPGLCAQAAVAAVVFARQGVTGAHGVFDGRYGLYPSHYGADYDPAALTQDLGREFRMLGIALKPYPCCSYSQEPLDATLDLVRDHRIAPGEVESITVCVASKHAAGLVDHPYIPRGCPQVDAQFSMQYVIASVVCRKSFGIAELQEAALREPAVLEFSRCVRVAVDPQREGHVEVRMRDGRVLEKRVELSRGHPRRPLSQRELQDKLAECGRYAALPRTPEQIAALARCIGGLDGDARGSDLAALLA
ncbi:MAG: MmgE/PrpD family protein [Betaproteobacteria bacterium]|nr:MmgE/PrpD family protein [Betaproteobacteria bacterium]